MKRLTDVLDNDRGRLQAKITAERAEMRKADDAGDAGRYAEAEKRMNGALDRLAGIPGPRGAE